MTRLVPIWLFLLVFLVPSPCPAIAAEDEAPPEPRLNDPKPTTVLVRVVAHGAMVLGREVGGARITITDVDTKQILATGIQQGDSGDQNQIMRTPHIMEEPLYSSRSSASYSTTLELHKPTLVEIAAEGPLAYPASLRRTTKTVLLVPGQDLAGDGIVLHLYGYIVQIEHPKPGEPLIARDDVKLRASIRTLSGSAVRPYGDWDSRKIRIYGELLIGDRIIERLQMFYSQDTRSFEAPFFVPRQKDATNGITLRVMAIDPATGNIGSGEANYTVLTERLPPKQRR